MARSGGVLLAGFANPVMFIFDPDKVDNEGILEVTYTLPYSDVDSLDAAELQQVMESGRPLEFSHSLEDQIGGQLDAGFLLSGFFEDRFAPEDDVLSRYMPTFIATRAVKP